MINCNSFLLLSFCLRKVILDGLRLIQMEANPNIADKYHSVSFINSAFSYLSSHLYDPYPLKAFDRYSERKPVESPSSPLLLSATSLSDHHCGQCSLTFRGWPWILETDRLQYPSPWR